VKIIEEGIEMIYLSFEMNPNELSDLEATADEFQHLS
jgi:hypothetical protein